MRNVRKPRVIYRNKLLFLEKEYRKYDPVCQAVLQYELHGESGAFFVIC